MADGDLSDVAAQSVPMRLMTLIGVGVYVVLDPLGAVLDPRDPLLQSERTQGFTADPIYGRAKCLPMLGAFNT